MTPLAINVQEALSLLSALPPLPAADFASTDSSLTQKTPVKTAYPGAKSVTTTTLATNAF